ncbi:MAG TPA: GerMN domain-containing protein [Rectinemataceae bacterium]|nr:GerMN domain-containing protein [Rectinemataceae bacterium]
MRNIFELALRRARGFISWVSPRNRLFAFFLAIVFLLSLAAWAIFDGETGYVLYFPTANGAALRGEMRNLPRESGTEARTQALVSEFLLGPANPELEPAFPTGTSLRAVIYRKGTLFVDIGEEAALLPEDRLKLAIRALDRSIHLGLHQPRRIVVTIGGFVPWDEGSLLRMQAPAKKP